MEICKLCARGARLCRGGDEGSESHVPPAQPLVDADGAVDHSHKRWSLYSLLTAWWVHAKICTAGGKRMAWEVGGGDL